MTLMTIPPILQQSDIRPTHSVWVLAITLIFIFLIGILGGLGRGGRGGDS